MYTRVRQSLLLFWFGLLGVVFYVIQPIAFPEVPVHPELLPVYSLMMGLGAATNGPEKARKQNGTPDEK